MTRRVRLGQPWRREESSGAASDHLLQVVEEEQHLPLADVLGEAVLCAEGLGDRLRDERGVAQGGEPDPEDARLVLRDECGSRLEREPGLARAPRPGQRHESSSLLDQGEDRFELLLPADEGTRRAREVRVRDRLERGEALVAELEDGDRVLDVLQAMLAEVGERAVDELGRCLGEDDLPTMACRGDTGGEVHVLSHVALICDARRPRVQADTNMDRAWGERLPRRGGRRCRGRCRGEREEEGVPLRVHLDSVVCLAGRSHDPSMHRERLFVRLVPDLLEQPGRALDVGEEEGDGAGREVVAHAA